jgi:hypothetical protein
MYYVKQHRDGRPVQQATKTAKEAAALGDQWSAAGPVKIETADGLVLSLEQFKKTVLGGVEGAEAKGHTLDVNQLAKSIVDQVTKDD